MNKHQWIILLAIVCQTVASQAVCPAGEEQGGGLPYSNGMLTSVPESIDKSYLNSYSEPADQSNTALESGSVVPFPFSDSPSPPNNNNVLSFYSSDQTELNQQEPGLQRGQETGNGAAPLSAFYHFNESGNGRETNGRALKSPLSEKPLSGMIPVKPMIEDKQGRDGIFQRITGKTTFVTSGGGAEGLGMTTVNLDLVFGFPLPTRRSPLLLTPYFQADFMDYSEVYPDFPSTLYRTGLNVAWIKPINDRCGLFLFASPCVSSDFEAEFNDAFRCPVGVIGNWTINPAWKVSLGVIYTDNDDWLIVPACGVTWTPNDLWKWELTVPRPRICRRIADPVRKYRYGKPEKRASDYWVYLAGEYQGGTWAIDAKEYWAARSDDRLQYRDLRIMLGIERDKKELGRIDWNAEIGLAFCRKMYFEDLPIVYRPKTAFVARIQAAF